MFKFLLKPNEFIDVVVIFLKYFLPGWSTWSSWSDCSVSCGTGTTTRNRTCLNGNPGDEGCTGNVEESMSCSTQSCVGKAHSRATKKSYVAYCCVFLIVFYFYLNCFILMIHSL